MDRYLIPDVNFILEPLHPFDAPVNRMTFFDLFKTHRPPLIQQCLDDMNVMLETTHEMFDAASAHLLDNEPLGVDPEAQDAVVNEKEQAIRRAVLEHVVIDPQHDLVFSLVLVSIVQDAERIGDLAKTMAETAALARRPRTGANVEALRDIRDHVGGMFETTRQAFIEGDAERAHRVMDDSRTTKARVTTFLENLAGQAALSGNEALVLGIAARVIGRTSSHLSNLASSVVLPFDLLRRDDESI